MVPMVVVLLPSIAFCLGVRQKSRDETTHPPHEKSPLTFLFPNIVSLSTHSLSDFYLLDRYKR
jgi:hypothetical protein